MCAQHAGTTKSPAKSIQIDGSNFLFMPFLNKSVSGLVLRRNKALGGVSYYEALNQRKKDKVYAVLRDGEKLGLLKGYIKQGSGSWMNIVFEVLGEGAEARFLAGAEAKGMKSLKGHR